MPVFAYKAVTESGLVVKNKIEETNKHSVVQRLKRNNLMPISIIPVRGLILNSKKQKKERKNYSDISQIMKNVNTANIMQQDIKGFTLKEKIMISLNANQKVTTRDLLIFTENFYLLKKANFNNIHALTTIIQSTENWTFKGILEDILAGLESGENMFTTMEYYSNVFPYIYINMIKVGELSGSMEQSLQQAVKYLEDSDDLNKRVRKMVIPNVALVVLLLILLVVGTKFGIPVVEGVYESVGSSAQLPAATLWFKHVVELIEQYWLIPTVVIVGAVAGLIYYINTPKGKYNFHLFKYKMPVFGELNFAIDFSRFMKAMLLNLQNGMRIQDSLEVAKNVVSNYVLLSIIETAINNIIMGTSWIEPFEKSGLASSMITEMLKIGMQTDLAEMMEKLVEYMEMDIEQIMQKIMAIMPQIIQALVGVVLVFFVLVILVPALQVYMGNFLFDAAGV